MAHIKVAEGAPGIMGLLKQYPESAKPLMNLAEHLLKSETEGLNSAERETIAAYVSNLNECVFCSESHAGAADAYWGEAGFSKMAWSGEQSAYSDRLKSYLKIAEQVQATPTRVNKEDVEHAKSLGATDQDLHDVVLIASAFCMFNRYVDALDTFAPPRGDQGYMNMGQMLAQGGYLQEF